VGGPLAPGAFDAAVEEGFQATATWHQARQRGAAAPRTHTHAPALPPRP
jgi:hypothetical protein